MQPGRTLYSLTPERDCSYFAAVGDDDAAAARALRAPLALLAPPLRSCQPLLSCCCCLIFFSALASESHERLAPRGGSQLDLEQPPQPAARVSIAEEPRELVYLHRRGRAQFSGSAHCGGKWPREAWHALGGLRALKERE